MNDEEKVMFLRVSFANKCKVPENGSMIQVQSAFEVPYNSKSIENPYKDCVLLYITKYRYKISRQEKRDAFYEQYRKELVDCEQVKEFNYDDLDYYQKKEYDYSNITDELKENNEHDDFEFQLGNEVRVDDYFIFDKQ